MTDSSFSDDAKAQSLLNRSLPDAEHQRRRRWLIVGGAVVVAALLVGGGTWLATRGGSDDSAQHAPVLPTAFAGYKEAAPHDTEWTEIGSDSVNTDITKGRVNLTYRASGWEGVDNPCPILAACHPRTGGTERRTSLGLQFGDRSATGQDVSGGCRRRKDSVRGHHHRCGHIHHVRLAQQHYRRHLGSHAQPPRDRIRRSTRLSPNLHQRPENRTVAVSISLGCSGTPEMPGNRRAALW